MNYLSLFSGIEAATVAWNPLGWKPVAFSEIDKTAGGFLAETYPHAPNLGDVTKITEEMVKSLGKIDLIIFGSPCQDLSIAGKQRGLDGARSGLFRDSIRIIQWARKHCGLRFALWENVPGAYSSNKGKDFTEVVASLAGLSDLDTPENGWGKEGAAVGDNGLLEWACLDAQWFGLAARRKRMFALLDFGDWESRPPILLEPEGLRGDSEPSRKTRENTACETQRYAEVCRRIGHGEYLSDEHASTLTVNTSADQSDLVIDGATIVRRLTPLECERIMGFPDGYTASMSNSQRYRALGNSMAVPVIRYIGEKIMGALA